MNRHVNAIAGRLSLRPPQRDSLEIVGSIGREGSNSGEFQNIHTLAVDSKGNLITAEITNKRLQKFVPKTSR